VEAEVDHQTSWSVMSTQSRITRVDEVCDARVGHVQLSVANQAIPHQRPAAHWVPAAPELHAEVPVAQSVVVPMPPAAEGDDLRHWWCGPRHGLTQSIRTANGLWNWRGFWLGDSSERRALDLLKQPNRAVA